MSLYPVGQFPAYRPRRLRQSPAMRQLVRETHLNAGQLVLPLFARSGRKLRHPIAAMPGVFQLSPDELVREAARAHEAGVPAVLIFGIPDRKDARASGAYAANVLGLSDQVPSRVVFLTDGPARKVKLGKQEIILQHTTPRNMATAGRKGGLIIQALRYLGEKQVDDAVLKALRRQIGDADRESIRKDLCHAPAWIADLLRPITAPQ